MNGKEGEQENLAIETTPLSTTEQVVTTKPKSKSKFSLKPFLNFVYDPKRKTVLGRSAMNWTKLSAFYSVFFFCLACFFVGLLYLFALTLHPRIPKYYNQDSTMTVRTSASIVGLGFRPQPNVRENLIKVSNDLEVQEQLVSSLRLYRDVYLTQKADARVEECTADEPADELPLGTACSFDWTHIVNSQNHPCSDQNLFGFKNQQPCVLVKINKVYDWTPALLVPTPVHTKAHGGISKNVTETSPDVLVTCDGAQADDKAVLGNLVYYSLANPSGSTKYGAVPRYYFPYRNAPDHVQPFVLVQFKDLPLDRTVEVLCQISAPGLQPDRRTMRGMVSFQLLRSSTNIKTKREL